ncbi:pyridoxamine 5'-phosphate oxidase family protein [Oceanicella sp. SM1341]|uniref:pyridoxamine 5'-phosphate oxidase family protein n=1 Tax=Oceanicella sp. SM1341 TaxID=1548889 RepID=UPI001300774D|nr:pyridoxamine 5'-phosphate oxidase family protein [Oceanicella sp. SM1341]
MADLERIKADPQAGFWSQLGESRAVMLGTPDATHHMQPMTPMPAPEEGAIWFFASRDSDIVRQSQDGGRVHMCLMGEGADYYACVDGKLEEASSPEHVERFWSPAVEAWYPEGKSDPDLTLLRLRPEHGRAWASTASGARFGREIAKANETGTTPDVGVVTDLTF